MSKVHRARKRFGQNFLHDSSIIERILAAASPRPDDNTVEIGPGQAALTLPLLSVLKHLHVVEIDRDLVALLAQKLPADQITMHNIDALKFDFTALATERPLRVIGNLPYNISTPLLFHLLDAGSAIQDMLFMLQKEVVVRLAAEPGSKQYGKLSVLTQYQARVEHLFDVPPEAFDPAPKVTSSIVRLAPHSSAPFEVGDTGVFRSIVTAAFSQRRKTLRNTLREFFSAESLAALDINPSDRAENLTPQAFGVLSLEYTRQHLAKNHAKNPEIKP